ncbi:MAG TPA: RNase adapter RapZ [Thermoanaerobaculia bacterium]|nr:RNase adapter RapZ [Thermoanaerobaculia bacterium]
MANADADPGARRDPDRDEPPAKEGDGKVRLVLITGLSGSGKSVVAKCFEDLAYYTVDNLPLPLLRQFLANPAALVPGHERIAVVTDVRAPGFALELPRLIEEIDRARIEPTLLFLEASDEVLVRRFSETRRPHPLSEDSPAIEGIRRERELLAEVRAHADRVLDSSEWTIHEIRSQIFREFAAHAGGEPGMVVSLVSFGFKRGIPYGTDLLFDVRFLPNPHFIPGLREKTGQEAEVVDFLESQEDYPEVVARLTDLLAYLLPKYRGENRSYLSVAIGCTGGKHRSVAVCEKLRAELEGLGWPARVLHRDIAR